MLTISHSSRVAHAASDPGDTISDFKFSPATITIHVGDTITWTNNGPSPHTATANDHSFDTGTLQKGQSASHTFTSPGTFAYICTIHSFMHGTVVVQAASSSSGSGSGSSTSSGSSSGSPGSSSPSSNTSTASTGSSTTVTPVATSPSLPNTGMNLLVTLLAAAVMIGAGTALRARRAAKRPRR